MRRFVFLPTLVFMLLAGHSCTKNASEKKSENAAGAQQTSASAEPMIALKRDSTQYLVVS